MSRMPCCRIRWPDVLILAVCVVGALFYVACGTAAQTAVAVPADVVPSESAPPLLAARVEPSETASITPSGAAAYANDPQALARGRGVFRALCTGYCHSSRTAERLAPDLFDCVWIHGDADGDIFQVISAGVTETQMQGFGGKLPDDDLWKIVAFLRAQSQCK